MLSSSFLESLKPQSLHQTTFACTKSHLQIVETRCQKQTCQCHCRHWCEHECECSITHVGVVPLSQVTTMKKRLVFDLGSPKPGWVREKFDDNPHFRYYEITPPTTTMTSALFIMTTISDLSASASMKATTLRSEMKLAELLLWDFVVDSNVICFHLIIIGCNMRVAILMMFFVVEEVNG